MKPRHERTVKSGGRMVRTVLQFINPPSASPARTWPSQRPLSYALGQPEIFKVLAVSGPTMPSSCFGPNTAV